MVSVLLLEKNPILEGVLLLETLPEAGGVGDSSRPKVVKSSLLLVLLIEVVEEELASNSGVI